MPWACLLERKLLTGLCSHSEFIRVALPSIKNFTRSMAIVPSRSLHLAFAVIIEEKTRACALCRKSKRKCDHDEKQARHCTGRICYQHANGESGLAIARTSHVKVAKLTRIRSTRKRPPVTGKEVEVIQQVWTTSATRLCLISHSVHW